MLKMSIYIVSRCVFILDQSYCLSLMLFVTDARHLLTNFNKSVIGDTENYKKELTQVQTCLL